VPSGFDSTPIFAEEFNEDSLNITILDLIEPKESCAVTAMSIPAPSQLQMGTQELVSTPQTTPGDVGLPLEASDAICMENASPVVATAQFSTHFPFSSSPSPSQHQKQVIRYLMEENRVLRERMGARRMRFSDDQRRRLAAKAKKLGRK